MLGFSLVVQSREIGNEAIFQFARVESAETEMVRARNRAIELEGLLTEFDERE